MHLQCLIIWYSPNWVIWWALFPSTGFLGVHYGSCLTYRIYSQDEWDIAIVDTSRVQGFDDPENHGSTKFFQVSDKTLDLVELNNFIQLPNSWNSQVIHFIFKFFGGPCVRALSCMRWDLFSDWEFLDVFGGRQILQFGTPKQVSVVTTKSLKWRHTSAY